MYGTCSDTARHRITAAYAHYDGKINNADLDKMQSFTACTFDNPEVRNPGNVYLESAHNALKTAGEDYRLYKSHGDDLFLQLAKQLLTHAAILIERGEAQDNTDAAIVDELKRQLSALEKASTH